MLKRIILKFIVLLLFFSNPVSAFAANMPVLLPGNTGFAAKQEFATSYDVVYDVDSLGITTVTEKINLTNLTSESYASQFKLIIGATQIFDIKASDGGGAMQVQSSKSGNSTIISVKFNQQIAGLNKDLSFTLQFKSKDFAEKIGKVWEVRTPKVSSINLKGYNLTLAVPIEFGDPTIISPTPKSQTTSSGKMFLTFEKDNLIQSGVSASFGDKQLFDYSLSYHLANNNLVPVLTSIALPPDTAYQDVIYHRIEPNPINVTVDNDGNYLAWYKLNRSQKLDVQVVGSAKLYSSSKVKNPQLDDILRVQYTKPDVYWESNYPRISAKLTEILGPDPPRDSTAKAKLIYQYVVNSLKYDNSRLQDNIKRLGAVAILNNPAQAVCIEFTDLFIALARSASIPARELDGFAYSSNTTLRPLSLSKDILHSWPEFWDENKGWVMVDPTWENTTGGVDYFNKLDLNHFVFAVKGFSSKEPIPAGSYKYPGIDSNDVKVTLSDTDFLGIPKLDVKIINPAPILAGFPQKIKIQVSNLGNAVYPSNIFLITANKLSILKGDSQKLGTIPPFGAAKFDLDIRTTSLFDKFNDQIVVTIGEQKFTSQVEIKPFIIFQSFPFIAIGIVLLMIAIYASILGGLIYRRKALKIHRKK